jgi:peptidoglycan/LPS O-acetylase OafA/YrhL
MSTAASPSLPRTLPILQVLRGVAAIFVVLFHLTWFGVATFKQFFMHRAFMFGHSGVDFFFVLSGFIMVYAHHADAGHAARTWSFLKARFARIFPIYWVVLAVTFVFYWFHPDLGGHAFDLDTAGRAALLYNQLDRPVVHVAWSLSFELFFYAVFTTFFWGGRLAFALVAALWCTLMMMTRYDYWDMRAPILLSPMIAEFVLGCVAAAIVIRWRPRVRVGWLLAAAVPWLVVAAADSWQWIDSYRNARNFALPYCLVILVAATYDVQRERRYPAVLLLLGDASYSIYLVHYMGVQWTSQFLFRNPAIAATLGVDVTLALACLVLVSAGTVVHLLVERPLGSWTRRMLGVRSRLRRASATHAAAAGTFMTAA